MTTETLKKANEISDRLDRVNDALKQAPDFVLRSRSELLSDSSQAAIAAIVRGDLQAYADRLRGELEAI